MVSDRVDEATVSYTTSAGGTCNLHVSPCVSG
jgi:hypothetical protein